MKQFSAGEVVKFHGAFIRIERVFGYTLTQVQIFGRFSDSKGKPLSGAARKGYAAGWFAIKDLQRDN